MEELLKTQIYLCWLESKYKAEKRPLHKVSIAFEIEKCKRILKEHS